MFRIRSMSFHSKILNGLNKNTSTLQEKPKSVLKEAEDAVGYPTSFLNLKFLLSDEVANIGLHLRKLIGTSHPLLATIAKELFNQNEVPPWGLIVLLVAKATGNKTNNDEESSAGILLNQRALAEITEMIRKSIQIHKGILNLPPFTNTDDVLNFGNKMALLSGDFLLSKSYLTLANIKNQDVTEIVSMGLRDLIASEFVGPRDNQNNPLPGKPAKSEHPLCFDLSRYENDLKADEVLGHWKEEWLLRNSLSGGNLLGRACQGCCIMAGCEDKLTKEAFVFGKIIALLCQGYLENKTFLESKLNRSSLISLPTLFYLHENPENYFNIEKCADDVNKIDYDDLCKEVMKGSAMKKCREVQRELCYVATKKLDIFPVESGRNVLCKVINSLEIVG